MLRGIGGQPILYDDELHVRVFPTDIRQQTFGRIAFTIIFSGAVLFQNRPGCQGKNLPAIRVDQYSPQHLMIVGDAPITMMFFTALIAVHF